MSFLPAQTALHPGLHHIRTDRPVLGYCCFPVVALIPSPRAACLVAVPRPDKPDSSLGGMARSGLLPGSRENQRVIHNNPMVKIVQ
jgi:hypothetical protein